MSSTRKLKAKSLPHIPGYTVWENANGFGRPGYLPGSGNQYADVVTGLASANKFEARVIACVILFVIGAVVGPELVPSHFGGQGAVIGILSGAAAGVAIGYFLGLFLVRLAALLLVLVPVSVLLWLVGSVLVDMWHR
jgi:hypothetical protein